MFVWALFAFISAVVVRAHGPVAVVDPERGRLTLRRWFGLSVETVPLAEITFVRLHTRRSDDDEADLTAVVLERRGQPMVEIVGYGADEVDRKRRFAQAVWDACAPSCAERPPG